MRRFCATGAAAVILATLTACSSSESPDSSSQASSPAQTPPDFGHTQIITATSAPSDGVSLLTVTLQLRNLDDSPIVRYQATYTLTPYTNATIDKCSLSDTNGNATCRFASSVPGARLFTLANIGRTLTTSVNFHIPGGDQGALALSGSVSTVTSGGYTVRLSLGSPIQRYGETTNLGNRVNLTTLGQERGQ